MCFDRKGGDHRKYHVSGAEGPSIRLLSESSLLVQSSAYDPEGVPACAVEHRAIDAADPAKGDEPSSAASTGVTRRPPRFDGER